MAIDFMHYYESVQHFASQTEINLAKTGKELEKYNKSFKSVSSRAEAIQLSSSGYIPSAWDSELDSIASTQESNQLQAVLGISGSVPDVGAFLQGVPECMWEFEFIPQPKLVRIQVPVQYNGATDLRFVYEYGACVFGFINDLKLKGVEVDVIATCTTKDVFGDGSTTQVNVSVHKAGTAFAPHVLGAALHPTFVRCHFIDAMNSGNADEGWAYNGAGAPHSPEQLDGYTLLPTIGGSIDRLKQILREIAEQL